MCLTSFSRTVKYVPSWFPGAGFQKKAAEWKVLAEEMPSKPFRAVKEAVVSVASRSLLLGM
jgi:hypothetical protein